MSLVNSVFTKGIPFSLCLLRYLNMSYSLMFLSLLTQYYYKMTPVTLKTLFLDYEFLQGRSHVLLIPVFPCDVART